MIVIKYETTGIKNDVLAHNKAQQKTKTITRENIFALVLTVDKDKLRYDTREEVECEVNKLNAPSQCQSEILGKNIITLENGVCLQLMQ